MSTNPTRLGRFAGLDHVSSRDRLIFTERRSQWRNKPLLLPLILLALVLWLYVLPAFGDKPMWGVSKHGAEVCVDNPIPEVLFFCFRLTNERR